VPVAAAVAPQPALFANPDAPARAPAPAALARPGAEPPEAAMPAFERHALLRDKRRRLVADPRRTQGGSHAEINRWLHRSCRTRRVEDASIDQLERSVTLLLGRPGGLR
jgi:hypothetical protein